MLQQVFAVTLNKITFGTVNTLADAMALAINIVLGIGVSLTIVFLIIGGIQYITSKGDQKATIEARTSLTNAVIGFIVVVGAFTIKTILGNILGVTGGDIDTEQIIPAGLEFE